MNWRRNVANQRRFRIRSIERGPRFQPSFELGQLLRRKRLVFQRHPFVLVGRRQPFPNFAVVQFFTNAERTRFAGCRQLFPSVRPPFTGCFFRAVAGHALLQQNRGDVVFETRRGGGDEGAIDYGVDAAEEKCETRKLHGKLKEGDLQWPVTLGLSRDRCAGIALIVNQSIYNSNSSVTKRTARRFGSGEL